MRGGEDKGRGEEVERIKEKIVKKRRGEEERREQYRG